MSITSHRAPPHIYAWAIHAHFRKSSTVEAHRPRSRPPSASQTTADRGGRALLGAGTTVSGHRRGDDDDHSAVPLPPRSRMPTSLRAGAGTDSEDRMEVVRQPEQSPSAP